VRSARRLSLVAGPLAVALSFAALAQAAFSPPVNVSADGQDAAAPAVAVDSAGNAMATWVRFDGTTSRAEARTISHAGALGSVHTLSAAGGAANSPRVAVDADGDALCVWTRLDGTHPRVQARQISSAGAVGPVRTLSRAGQTATNPEVAIDGDGDAYVVWYRSDVGALQVFGRAISAAGAVGPLQALSRPEAHASNPRLALDASGDGYAIWIGSDGVHSRAQGRTLSSGGALGAIKNLSAPGANAGFARVGVDASGNAFVIWTRQVAANTRVQGRPVSSAGNAGAIETLSAVGQNAVLPEISVGVGNGVAVWARSDGTNTRIQAMAVSPLGGVGSVHTLSAPGHGATAPQVAVDSNGIAAVVWQRSDGAHLRIQERPFSPFASPQPIVNLSPVGSDAAAPDVARSLGTGGEAVAVWSHPDDVSSHQRIQASVGP